MNYEYFYSRFRWLLFNRLNYDRYKNDKTWFKIYKPSIYSVRNEYHDNTERDFRKPNEINKLIIDYKSSRFEVKQSLIDHYHRFYIKPYINPVKNNEMNHGGYVGFNPSFIERIRTPLNPQKKDFLDEIKERIILHRWWDYLNKDELILKLIKYHFLESTKSLIGEENLIEELKKKYRDKDALLDDVFKNFEFSSDDKIKRLKSITKTSNEDYLRYPFFKIEKKKHHSVFYEYNNLFRTEFVNSIRTWENEIRMDYGFKTSGTWFNEDLLFKTILQEFGQQYKVVSQGSPHWLKPQKFDVYLPELNIAIEYQGEQHFRPVDFSGKGESFAIEQFEMNQKRDELKRKKCFDNGCVLLEMRYDDEVDQFMRLLKSTINKNTL